ncbi:MAG: InlB B-repeat-containing protein, partial [Clostridia bacterium]|nr:InlB B-repeat-containing protein [Clostridia bacterium]
MKKKIIAITAICAAITMTAGLAACDNTPKDEGTYYTVTYMDGTTVLKTEKVKEGETPAAYTPTKEGGYQFVDWFATPSKNHRYDITSAITEDVTVYAGFTLYSDDTRDFYVIGAGTSTVLIDGWGNINDAHKLTKTDGKNEYKITLDLLEGDQFVIVAGVEYESKRGAGYLVTSALADGTEVFGGAGSVYDDSSKGKNIEVKYSGNYTLTLNTYPGDDYYNTAGEGYTEARKEIYRMGTYDTISWERNGNPEVTTVSVTDYFIKGKNISKWGNYINDAHLMKREGNNYSLSIYLEEGEEFMFASWNTVTGNGEQTSALGSTYIKSNALDTAAQALLNGYSETGGNMTAKASGVYTFNYNESTKVLTVTLEDKAETQYDYYLDGKYGDQNWKAETLGGH